MNNAARRASLSLGALLVCVLGAWAGERLSSPSHILLPFGDGAVGEASSSGIYKLSSDGSQSAVTITTSASTSHVLGGGLMHAIAFPGTVTDLTGLSNVSASSITLQWSAPGYDGQLGSLQAGTSYHIRVASYTVPDTFISSATEIILVSTFSIMPGARVSTQTVGLLPNTTYFAQLWTKDSAGNLSFSSPRATFTTLSPAPKRNNFSPPTDFLEVNFTSVTIRWAALPIAPPVETSEGYRVEASSTDFGAFLPGGMIHSSATFNVRNSTLTILEPELDAGTTYYFRVASLNWVGLSSFTVLGSTKTKLQAATPQTLLSTYTAISSYSATVSWDPSDGNPSGAVYTLEASTASDFTGYKPSSTTFNSSFNMFTLFQNTTYYFRVKASTDASTSAFLDFKATSTMASPPLTAVSTYTGVFPSSMSVVWSPGSNFVDRTTYTIVFSTGDSYPNSFAGNLSYSTTPAGALPATTVMGLAQNTTYFFFVAALNHNSVPTVFTALGSTVTLVEAPLPATPSFLMVGGSSMTVQWQVNSNPVGVTTYTIVLSTGLAFPNNDGGTIFKSTAPGAAAAATFTGLPANTTYYLFARAINHAGTATVYQALGSTATRAAVPIASVDYATFTDFSATGFTLHWSSGSAIAGYNAAATTYYYQLSRFSDFVPVSSQSFVVGLSSVVTSLLPNTTYFTRVAAYSHYQGTWTAFTVFGDTATLANGPNAASPAFPAVGQTSATVSWGRNFNPVDVTTYPVVFSLVTPYDSADPGNILLSTAPAGAAPAATITGGLALNTTYYVFAAAANHYGAVTGYGTLGSTATLASGLADAAVTDVQFSSFTLSWTPVSAQGYALETSSTNFSVLLPGGSVYFSSTPVGGASSLSQNGLDPNTTHYFRVSSLNWNSVPTSVRVSSRSTLALQVTNYQLFQVNETSVTVNWKAFPPTPDSATARGYVLDAATASALGDSDFGGQLFSSVTYTLASTTLTVGAVLGLDPGTTYAFRLGSLNWESQAHYRFIGSTKTNSTPMNWDNGGGNNNWYNSANWNPNGIPGAGTPVTIAMATSVFVSVSSPAISFSSLTLGSPAGVSAKLIIATTVANGRDVLIYGGASFVQGTTDLILLNGDFTMVSGSSVTSSTSGVNIRITGLFDVQAGATIAVSSMGFAGGVVNLTGPGAGPGGGRCDTTSSAGGTGAGHGGAGGDSNAGPVPIPGITYDSLTVPILPGSGGGGGDGAGGAGGAGGGVVILEATTFSLQGRIVASAREGFSAAGLTSVTAGGGGSGGTVRIKTATLLGGGTIQADGGAGGNDTLDNDPGGGGGGGRISIEVTLGGSVCGLNLSAAGGAAGTGGTGVSTAGANGTISSTMTLGVPAFSPVYATSDTIHWTWTQETGGLNYQLRSSTGGLGQSPVLEPSVTFYTETGLLPNTSYTHFIQITACGASSDSISVPFSTLASTVTALAQSFPAVDETFVTVGWAAFPGSPGPATSEGYRLEASSSANYQGVVVASQTFNVQSSTLSVAGLLRNTTYFFRVASLNHSSAISSYTALGSTSTLALPPVPLADPFLMVAAASSTLRWAAFSLIPPATSALSANGFIVEASTTNFGVASPGGSVYSSTTWNVLSSTLTILASPADICQPTYFRVGSLNWSGHPNYTVISSTAGEDYGVIISTFDLDIGQTLVNAEVVISTSFIVSNPGCLVTYHIKAATITAGSPWTISTTSGTDTFTLQALFNAGKPTLSQFLDTDKLTDTAVASTPTRFALGQTGERVGYAQNRLLWFKLGMPRITSVDTAQQVRVTVYARVP